MDNQPNVIKKRHSFSLAQCHKDLPDISCSREFCKSDINVSTNNNFCNIIEVNNLITSKEKYKDYYKTYDQDVVTENDSCNDHSFSENHDSGDNKTYSITNSDIDKLELKILSKMSEELQRENNSVTSLDSNIKLFKTTVQQIFDNFQSNMEDFEIYKKKFHDILKKNKGDRIAMENFIKDMLKHISSTDSSMTNNGFNEKFVMSDEEFNQTEDFSGQDNAIETFKNNNYLTDSTFDQNSSKLNSTANKETVNIYLLNGSPYIHIKLNERSLFSEINIRDQCIDGIKEIASTENLKKLAAKNMEMENYIKQENIPLKDRDIPIKYSSAKKNIHMNEDFNEDKDESNKFFIFKICDYICRKIRRNTFG